MNRHLQTTVAVLLAASVLLSGCATHYVFFDSDPAGATVTAAGQSADTPCLLKLPSEPCTAEIRLSDTQSRTVNVPKGPGVVSKISVSLLSTVSTGLKISSVPFFLVGGTGLLLVRLLIHDHNDDHYPYYPWQTNNREDRNTRTDLLKITFGGLVVGGILYIGGDSLAALAEDLEDRPQSRFHIDFKAPLQGEPPSQTKTLDTDTLE